MGKFNGDEVFVCLISFVINSMITAAMAVMASLQYESSYAMFLVPVSCMFGMQCSGSLLLCLH